MTNTDGDTDAPRHEYLPRPPPRYARYQRRWELLNWPACAAMAVVFRLMVNKPAFSA